MGTKEEIDSAVTNLGDKYADEMKKTVNNLLANVFEKGVLPKDAMGLSDAMMEGIYGHAYRLYNSGRYREASQLFRLLILLNPLSSKYSLGLAACFHMLKEYDNAAQSYMMVSLVDPESPIPFYHASDCFIQLNLSDSAIIALEKAIELAGTKEQFSMIKERCLFTLESLKGKTVGEKK